MKEIKLKERLENAFEAFFDDGKLNENNSLEFSSNAESFQDEESQSFAEKNKTLVNILKQVFLFLPGALFLFFLSVAFTGFFVIRPEGYVLHFYFSVFVMMISSLMTILGLGNIKNPKHFIIPASIIFSGMVLGLAGELLFNFPYFGYFIYNYLPYFFPLALITPILAKNIVDNLDEKDSL